MSFDAKHLLDELFGPATESRGGSDRIWINAEEFSRRTAGMTSKQVGELLLDICELHKRGLMKNGPAVRIDPPEDEEATDGPHTQS